MLNGAKMWISLADVADHFLVFATLDRAQKHKAITAFIVERGMPGFTTGTINGKLGIWAGNTGELAFDNVRVPIENRVGEEGEGFTIAMSAIDQGRFTVASAARSGSRRRVSTRRSSTRTSARRSARRSASTSSSSR